LDFFYFSFMVGWCILGLSVRTWLQCPCKWEFSEIRRSEKCSPKCSSFQLFWLLYDTLILFRVVGCCYFWKCLFRARIVWRSFLDNFLGGGGLGGNSKLRTHVSLILSPHHTTDFYIDNNTITEYTQTRLQPTAQVPLNLFVITGFCCNRVDLCSEMTILDWQKSFVITDCSL